MPTYSVSSENMPGSSTELLPFDFITVIKSLTLIAVTIGIPTFTVLYFFYTSQIMFFINNQICDIPVLSDDV